MVFVCTLYSNSRNGATPFFAINMQHLPRGSNFVCFSHCFTTKAWKQERCCTFMEKQRRCTIAGITVQCTSMCVWGTRIIMYCCSKYFWKVSGALLGSRIISPRALDPRTLGPRTLDPRHPKSQGPVILGPMVLRTISPGILGPWKPWPLGPKVLWLKVLGPMVQGT